jgi:hypothetical protein
MVVQLAEAADDRAAAAEGDAIAVARVRAAASATYGTGNFTASM